jgi:hypothetical protein
MHIVHPKADPKKIAPIVISRAEIRSSIRIPLPRQTGGRHKDVRRRSRQEQKIALGRGEE